MNSVNQTDRIWTIVIADDVPIVRLGLRRIVESVSEFRLVGEAENGRQAIDMVRSLSPELLLLDLDMPEISGMEVMEALTPEMQSLKIAILTGSTETKDVLNSFERGARGVIAKDVPPAEILTGIRAVLDGKFWLNGHSIAKLKEAIEQLRADVARPFKQYGLTPRESEIVSRIVNGLTNKELAEQFGISEDTIKRHLSNIFDKVGASNRLELVLFALHHNLA